MSAIYNALRKAHTEECRKTDDTDLPATVYIDEGRGDMYIVIGDHRIMVGADGSVSHDRRVWQEA